MTLSNAGGIRGTRHRSVAPEDNLGAKQHVTIHELSETGCSLGTADGAGYCGWSLT